MQYDKGVEYHWCIGRYKGEQASAVLALANSSVGYFVRTTSGRGQGLEVEVGFRRVKDSPLPEYLEEANDFQVEKLEKLWINRHSLRQRA